MSIRLVRQCGRMTFANIEMDLQLDNMRSDRLGPHSQPTGKPQTLPPSVQTLQTKTRELNEVDEIQCDTHTHTHMHICI